MIPPLFYTPVKRDLLKLTGRDRASFLQGMVSNDVVRLQPGEGTYAFMLDATGHVLSDMRVLNIGDYLLLDLESGMAPFVAETLDKYLIMEKCRITDVTGEMQEVVVGGTEAVTTLESLAASSASLWKEGSNGVVALGSSETNPVIAAANYFGDTPLFTIYFAPSDADEVSRYLQKSGGQELPAETLDALRVEAGVPRFGIDIEKSVLAPETGQSDRAISFRKGCYIGQEIIARIDARGRTNRGLVRYHLNASSGMLPEQNTQVFVEGKSIGRVTSAAISPISGMPIAIGYLRNEYATPGRIVALGAEDGATAHVA